MLHVQASPDNVEDVVVSCCCCFFFVLCFSVMSLDGFMRQQHTVECLLPLTTILSNIFPCDSVDVEGLEVLLADILTA